MSDSEVSVSEYPTQEGRILGVKFTVRPKSCVVKFVPQITKVLLRSEQWTYVLESNGDGTHHMHGVVLTKTPVGKLGQQLWKCIGGGDPKAPAPDGSLKKAAIHPKALYEGTGWQEYCSKEGVPVRSEAYDEQIFKKAGLPHIPESERRSSKVSTELRQLDEKFKETGLEWDGTYKDLVRVYNTMVWDKRVVSFKLDPRQRAYLVQAWFLWRTRYTGCNTSWSEIKEEAPPPKKRQKTPAGAIGRISAEDLAMLRRRLAAK